MSPRLAETMGQGRRVEEVLEMVGVREYRAVGDGNTGVMREREYYCFGPDDVALRREEGKEECGVERRDGSCFVGGAGVAVVGRAVAVSSVVGIQVLSMEVWRNFHVLNTKGKGGEMAEVSALGCDHP